MLEGHDIDFEGKIDHEDVDFVKRGFRAAWEGAIFEPIGSGAPIDGFFVYVDNRARQSWSDEGRTVENENKMIVVLADELGMTFVLDGKNTHNRTIVEDITFALRLNRKTFGRE